MLTAVANALARVVSIATLFVSIPLTLHYLGQERYGMWLTLSAAASVLSFLDFGIGNGLLSAVSTSLGRDDVPSIRGYISSAFVVLTLVAVLLLGLLEVLQGFVPWADLLNVRGDVARGEAASAATLLVAIFAVSIPVGAVQRVQLALQKGFMASLWQCGASIVSLVGIFAAIRIHAGIAWLLLSFFGAPLALSFLNGLVFFVWIAPEFAPRLRFATFALAKTVARSGTDFFVLQLTVPLAFTVDAFIIARLLGAQSVPLYAIPERLFSVATILLSFVLAPLWPAYGEAVARGDRNWVRVTLTRSLLIAISLATAWSVFVLIFGGDILRFWVGSSIQPSLALLGGLAVWKVVEAAGAVLATFLNGHNAIRVQVWCGLATAVLAVGLKIALVPVVGLPAVPWSTLAAFILAAVIPFGAIAMRHIGRGHEGEGLKNA